MTHKALLAVAFGATALLGCADVATAGDRRERVAKSYRYAAVHPRGYYYSYRKRGPRVYGYAARRGGGYSYDYSDAINTYGDKNALFSNWAPFRDPIGAKQTPNGPFDSGFFFDSGVAPRGGDSPYQH